jgi:hypothetical protein
VSYFSGGAGLDHPPIARVRFRSAAQCLSHPGLMILRPSTMIMDGCAVESSIKIAVEA